MDEVPQTSSQRAPATIIEVPDNYQNSEIKILLSTDTEQPALIGSEALVMIWVITMLLIVHRDDHEAIKNQRCRSEWSWCDFISTHPNRTKISKLHPSVIRKHFDTLSTPSFDISSSNIDNLIVGTMSLRCRNVVMVVVVWECRSDGFEINRCSVCDFGGEVVNASCLYSKIVFAFTSLIWCINNLL